jgi:hypothetical protein
MAPHLVLAPEDVLLLRVVFQAVFTSGGRWPVFQYVDQAAFEHGIAVPHRCLEGIGADLVRYDLPLTSAARCRLSVRGMIRAEPAATVVHRGFLQVIRGLSDRWGREELLSPAEPQPVLVPAKDLWSPKLGTSTELRIVGLLLEVEEVGSIEWTDDPASPFSIQIDYDIRRLGGAISIPSYLQICDSEED